MLVKSLISIILILPFQSLAQSQSASINIFHVPMPPNWPVLFAPDVPASLRLSSSAQFRWEFSYTGGKCTSNGRTNLNPCVGRVVDYNFIAGNHTVRLTVTDQSLSQPIVISKQIRIFQANQFPTAVRPEVRSTSDEWFKSWTNGMYRIKELGIYDHLARIHIGSFSVNTVQGTTRSAAHSGPAFLIWHRMFMRVTERAIATAIGDDRVGLPYWDWTKGWNGLDELFGPTGDRNDQFILKSGPWCQDPSQDPSPRCPKRWSLPSDYPSPIKSLTRQLGADSSFQFMTQSQYELLMRIPAYDAAPFNDAGIQGSFRNALEGWISSVTGQYGQNHNGVHRWIGGTMSNVMLSFNDPLFLIHHSEVDKIFTEWQKQNDCDDGRGSRTCYRPGISDPDVNRNTYGAQLISKNGTSQYAIVGHMYDDVMYPWNLTISSMLRAENGYRFLDTNTQAPAISINRIDPSAEPLILSNGSRQDPSLYNNVYPVVGENKTSSADSYSSSMIFSSFIPLALALI